MKSRASLFLTVLSAGTVLTACGKEPAKNDRNDVVRSEQRLRRCFGLKPGQCSNNDAIIGWDDHTVTARTPIPPP